MKKAFYLWISCMTAVVILSTSFAAEDLTEIAVEMVTEEETTDDATYLSQFDVMDYIDIADYDEISVSASKEDSSAVQDEIGKYLLNNSTFLKELPQPFVNRNTSTLKDTLQAYADTYKTTLSDFMKYYNPDSTEETYEQDIKDMGMDYSKKLAAMQAVAEKEALTVSDEELAAQIETQAKAAGFDDVSEYKKAAKLDPEELREVMMSTKVLEFLQNKAVFAEEAAEEITENTTE